nr:ral guanine nucleotide dissociation stimulator-like [Equus caballus]
MGLWVLGTKLLYAYEFLGQLQTLIKLVVPVVALTLYPPCHTQHEDESTLSVTEACRMRALQLLRLQHIPLGPGPAVYQVTARLVLSTVSESQTVTLDIIHRSHLPYIPDDALIPFGTHGGSLAHCVRDAGGQDHLPKQWSPSCLWKGTEPVKCVSETFSLSCSRASSKAAATSRARASTSPRARASCTSSLTTCDRAEPASPESATPGPEQGPPLKAAPEPAPELEPTGRCALLSLPLPSAPVTSRLDPAPEPSCPWAVTTKDQLREERSNLLDFPPQLVAEQLTRMAAELFKTLVPAHCLGSIWSQRDNRERKYLAPTVRDTVMHDNTVANCILLTCLGDRSMTAQDRARVVELWIRVAEGHIDLDLRSQWGQAHFLPCVELQILVPGSVTRRVTGVPSLASLGICDIQDRRSP